MAAFGSFALLIALALAGWNLLAGALITWVIALGGLECYMPIGSYTAAWPLVFATVALFGGMILSSVI